jgi:hypothetical protein
MVCVNHFQSRRIHLFRQVLYLKQPVNQKNFKNKIVKYIKLLVNVTDYFQKKLVKAIS